MQHILQLCLASFVGVKNFLFLFWGILLFGPSAKLGVRFVFLIGMGCFNACSFWRILCSHFSFGGTSFNCFLVLISGMSCVGGGSFASSEIYFW